MLDIHKLVQYNTVMVDIIQAIYLSHTCGIERFRIPQDKNYDRLIKKEDELYEILKASLTPELFKILDDFINAMFDRHSILCDQYYTAGFKIGLRLAMQANDFSDIFG